MKKKTQQRRSLPRRAMTPKGWRRLLVGEMTRKGDWLENVGDGPWTRLRVRYCLKEVEGDWRAIIRRTTSRKRSPNADFRHPATP
jgi:hypothetical protein